MIKYKCLGALLMKCNYEYALGMMKQGNQEMAEIITKFFDSIPEDLAKKIHLGKEKGTARKESKSWIYEDDGTELAISVGEAKNANKDYMGLLLAGVTKNELEQWPRFQGDKLIGYLSIYLYGNNQKERPRQVVYEYYARRVDKKIIMHIKTNINASYKDTANKLEKLGLSEMHQKIINEYYEIDVDKILNKDNKR